MAERPSKCHPLVVFGSVNIDMVARLHTLPVPGETLHAQGAHLGLGGKGANQAVAVARLGAPVTLAGRMGDDMFAGFAADALRRFGVSDSHLFRAPAQMTGLAMICTDAAGENTIVVAGGANLAMDDTDVARLAACLTPDSIVLMQCEIPLPVLLAAARRAAALGATLILDPAPVPPGGLPDEAFRLATLMTPNETETERLTGIRPHDPDSARRAAHALHSRGLRQAIVKLGAQGVFFSDDTRQDDTRQNGPRQGFVRPFRVTAIDSVAAGDCFNGGLAVALARGQDLAAATRFAAACGALATTRKGASDAAPTLAEVESLLAAQPE
ncbi:PfkB family carbohydrate kinase [Nguyenibacter vanlangensis]|uniref:Ribokinase n=2 Tax=Nguyenibacter vanlangensis TaxID=1216886 RepID=A0ABZ3D584_9PROT